MITMHDMVIITKTIFIRIIIMVMMIIIIITVIIFIALLPAGFLSKVLTSGLQMQGSNT